MPRIPPEYHQPHNPHKSDLQSLQTTNPSLWILQTSKYWGLNLTCLFVDTSATSAYQTEIYLDDTVEDCKLPPNIEPITESHSASTASASSQGPSSHLDHLDDSKNLALNHPIQDQASSPCDIPSMPQQYIHGPLCVCLLSFARFSEPENQAISQTFLMDMETFTISEHNLQSSY